MLVNGIARRAAVVAVMAIVALSTPAQTEDSGEAQAAGDWCGQWKCVHMKLYCDGEAITLFCNAVCEGWVDANCTTHKSCGAGEVYVRCNG